MQHQHQTTPFKQCTFEIILWAANVQSPANLGGLFRVADSFGIAELLFTGIEPSLDSKRLTRTSRNTHTQIPYQFFKSNQSALDYLREIAYRPVALEITTTSQSIYSYNFRPKNKLALIIGEERSGIAPELLTKIEDSVHIDMYGTNSSMNVVVASGIALYEITNQLRAQL